MPFIRTPLRGNLARGFTIIEVLIATALVLIVMGFVIGMQYVLSQAREVTIRNYYNVDTNNVAINSITREIRTARLSEIGTYPIESANDNELIFYSDIDFDSRIERVRYTLTDQTLVKGVIEPAGQPIFYNPINETEKTISTSVQNGTIPLFIYYNGDWPTDTDNNPLSTPPSLSNIKSIKIELIVDTGEDDPYTLKSFTSIRMLKENL